MAHAPPKGIIKAVYITVGIYALLNGSGLPVAVWALGKCYVTTRELPEEVCHAIAEYVGSEEFEQSVKVEQDRLNMFVAGL